MGNAFSFRRLTSAAIVGLITVSGVPLPVQAGPLVLTIDQPDRVGVNAGSTLDFTGTITNNTGSSLDAAADLFLNFNNFDSAVLSFDQLLGNPDFVLPNGATSADILLFDANVGLLATAAGSPYLADVQVQDSLGDLSNDVTISISVPEPASLTLLLGALVILISFTKRAKRVVTLYRLLPALAAAILSPRQPSLRCSYIPQMPASRSGAPTIARSGWSCRSATAARPPRGRAGDFRRRARGHVQRTFAADLPRHC